MRSLVAYRPRRMDLLEDMDRFFDSFITATPQQAVNSPAVDIREEEDRYVLEAELPGLNEKDVDVKVEENLLTLSSSREENHEEKKNGYLIRERKAASFNRSFVLPKDVDRERIEARFRNGLLTLTIPKNPKDQPRRIEIRKD